MYFETRRELTTMKQMLKKVDSRSRRLKTIIEIAENQDENGNLEADSTPVKEEISNDFYNATILTEQSDRRPSSHSTAVYSPRERTVSCSHATPQIMSATSSYWREMANVSETPAGVVSSSSESLMGSPLKTGRDITEVELFFPEFFTDVEMQKGNKQREIIHKEPNKNSQKECEDPLVQSWLDLFGSQVYG